MMCFMSRSALSSDVEGGEEEGGVEQKLEELKRDLSDLVLIFENKVNNEFPGYECSHAHV